MNFMRVFCQVSQHEASESHEHALTDVWREQTFTQGLKQFARFLLRLD
jgi:hypothetical protein